MKNSYKLIAILSFVGILIAGCNKDLSLKPSSFSTTDQTNADELTNQLAAVYNPLDAVEMYGAGLWGYFAAGNDEGFDINGTSTSTASLTETFRSSSNDATYLGFWKDLYQGIERANILLSVVDKPDMDSVTRANIKGQALFMRAYYFYLLVNNFGDVPYKTMPSSTMGTNFNLPETPSKNIYDSIIKDMTAADSLVQSIGTVQTTTIVSKSAVEAILTRVCMSAAGYPVNGGTPYYQKALYWSNKLITAGVHSLNYQSHPLYPATPAYARLFINNMQNNFTDNNLSEGIWDAAFLSNGVGANIALGYPVTQQLGAVLGPICPSPSQSKSTGQFRAYPTLVGLYGAGDTRKDWVLSTYSFDGANKKISLGAAISIVAGKTVKARDTIRNKDSIIIKIDYDTTFYGSGATATATIDFNTGAISSISVINGGSGYVTTPAVDTPTVSVTGLPSKGKNFKYHIVINPVDGSISAINVINGGTGYLTSYDRPVAKWRREFELNTVKNPTYTSCNFPIIRYADVLLMAAEADLQLNGGNASTMGIEYYNQVKRRAYGFNPTAVGSAVDVTTVTLDSIKAERSRELCFEGVRRNDLKRWGLSSYVNTINNLSLTVNANIATNPPSSSISNAAVLPITNFLYNPVKYTYFPIPASELLLESGLSQNPGW